MKTKGESRLTIFGLAVALATGLALVIAATAIFLGALGMDIHLK